MITSARLEYRPARGHRGHHPLAGAEGRRILSGLALAASGIECANRCGKRGKFVFGPTRRILCETCARAERELAALRHERELRQLRTQRGRP